MECFKGRTFFFFYRGIYLLPEKWKKVIANDNNGKYFE